MDSEQIVPDSVSELKSGSSCEQRQRVLLARASCSAMKATG